MAKVVRQQVLKAAEILCPFGTAVKAEVWSVWCVSQFIPFCRPPILISDDTWRCCRQGGKHPVLTSRSSIQYTQWFLLREPTVQHGVHAESSNLHLVEAESCLICARMKPKRWEKVKHSSNSRGSARPSFSPECLSTTNSKTYKRNRSS